ncbi:ABC-type transport auxiliary lipoprotein family protein [Aureimonas leprariae]|uniref:ABC transporter n=1 Tax=Plantimonas leprariae TaxID=2615207 RepID=A0A7V7PQZ7_9HYPH|nr:ABC-type transport auxiliary lipoprotein family protein [Aureimonas leprariae]KAB0680843.1 ABC transporter [Aureimonas leprariae]
MSHRFRMSAALALVSALSGCAALGGTTPRDTYELSSPSTAASAPARKRLQLLIPDPTAIKTLDSNQIVVKPTPYSVEALQNSQWSDRLPRIVQLRMVQAFENTGRVGAVGVPGQGLAIDYQVIMEIRRFEIAAGQGRQSAQVEIAVKILNDRNGTVRATRTFTGGAPVSGTGNAAFVAALDKAFDGVAREIVTWTLQTV